MAFFTSLGYSNLKESLLLLQEYNIHCLPVSIFALSFFRVYSALILIVSTSRTKLVMKRADTHQERKNCSNNEMWINNVNETVTQIIYFFNIPCETKTWVSRDGVGGVMYNQGFNLLLLRNKVVIFRNALSV